MTHDEMVDEFVQLEKDRRALEEALRGVKSRLEKLQEPMQEYFLDRNLQNLKIGGITLYMHSQPKVRPKNGKDDVLEALRAIGHEELIRVDYHWTQLNALVKGMLEDGDLPPELDATVEIKDEISIRSRSAK